MKITRKQLRKIIKESMSNYRTMYRHSRNPFKNPSVEYSNIIADLIGGEVQEKTWSGGKTHITVHNHDGIEHSLELTGTVSWPQGNLLIRNVFNDEHQIYHASAIHFPVTGEPSIDAEFIKQLMSFNDNEFVEIGKESMLQKKGYEWANYVMPGYPHKYLAY